MGSFFIILIIALGGAFVLTYFFVGSSKRPGLFSRLQNKRKTFFYAMPESVQREFLQNALYAVSSEVFLFIRQLMILPRLTDEQDSGNHKEEYYRSIRESYADVMGKENEQAFDYYVPYTLLHNKNGEIISETEIAEKCYAINENLFYEEVIVLLLFLYQLSRMNGNVNAAQEKFLYQLRYYLSIEPQDWQRILREEENGTINFYKGDFEEDEAPEHSGRKELLASFGLNETAQWNEVRTKYRELAKTFHPDNSLRLDADERSEREEKFKHLTAAYRELNEMYNRERE